MVNLLIPTLGDKFQDYREGIPGDSYGWGPAIDASRVKYFFFHHSVTPQTAKNDGNWKAECDKIANIHINSNGWSGVGYRFIITSDGTVAYVGDLSHGGSAVGGNNNIAFSACFIGDFTKELPTAMQIHSAHLLAKWFIESMPQYPLIDGWDKIYGHQEASSVLHLTGAEPTACPGSNWRVAGDNLYERIKNDKWDGYPEPRPSAPTPIAPEPVPPTSTPPVVDYRDYLIRIRQVMYAPGFSWMKMRKIKEILAQTGV